MKKAIFTLSILLLGFSGLLAQFSGGAGTSGSPWQISNTTDLSFLSANSGYWGDYFIQTADIDAPLGSFSPIGNNIIKFTGSYDGDRHTIDGLYINSSTTDYCGLFGYTSSDIISNLGLTNVNISARYFVGGLVGRSNGTITECYSTGSVIANGWSGGLVGQNYGTITKCYSTGSVTGAGNYIGGLVGTSIGPISECYSTCIVTAGAYYNIGGLVGATNSGPISECYSTGSVTGNNYVGGLVGNNYYSSTVTECYSTGSVTGNNYVSGLVAFNGYLVNNSFWDMETSGQTTSDGGTGKTTAEMKTQSTFTSAGWNFINIWVMDGYPVFQGAAPNNPPLADAGADQIIDCAPTAGADVTLDGSGSSDPDSDPLSYSWSEGVNPIATGVSPTVTLAVGTHTITLTVDDGNGGTDTDDVVITVNTDTESPVITLNGNNPVSIVRFSGTYEEPSAEVTDNCDENPSLDITGSVNTNLPGVYFINYEALDTSSNTSQVTRTVNVIDDSNALGHPYLYLADDKIKLDKMGQSEGDMHSNDKIDIKKGPAIFVSDLTAVNKIDIHKDVTIDGDVTAGDKLKLGNNVIITGDTTSYGNVSSVSLLQLSFSAGGQNVKVKKNETLVLSPGSYGKIKVEKNATLKLSSGEYFFEELKFEKEGHFEIELTTGPVTVNVVKKIDFKKDVEMSILPLGQSDSRYVTINSLKDMHVDQGSILLGSFNSPVGKIHLKKEVYLRGSLCADKIDVDKDVEALHHYIGIGESLQMSNEEKLRELRKNTELPQLPQGFALKSNYPNPFNPMTRIDYALPFDSKVSLQIFDVLGREVVTLVNENQRAGYYTVDFNASNLASGIYYYRMLAGDFIAIKKMVVIK